jgi:type I restriction enzyme, R subunit
MTEADVCRNFVLPSIYTSGWDNTKIKEQFFFTDGRIEVTRAGSRRREGKKADYILFYKPHLPLAIIEAKDDSHSHHDGMSQAIQYGEILEIPFVYSTNGKKYLEHDRTTGIERELEMNDLPRPEDLYARWLIYKGYNQIQEQIAKQNYYIALGQNQPRYYQRNAINKVVEAVMQGQKRIMLVMATGTGKTFTAFHIIHKLWKTKKKKKILFLADRNILVDQTITGDFAPFGDIMTKISGKDDIRTLSSHEIFLSLYQALIGRDDDGYEGEYFNTSEASLYKQFPPDFFDLIIIDECHRGSAKADSSWRQILDYFSSATQIGMTATPKNTFEADNYGYFGDPIYTYSLKQGIEDGFLAPYRVIKYTLDVDAEGYRPDNNKVDKYGNIVEDRIYNSSDFDRNIVIDERIEVIAKEVTNYLKATDRYAKTIIFCENTEHAAMMRSALQNENSDITQPNYVVRITGNEFASDLNTNLYNFVDQNKTYPVIATTSKLLSTGVDIKTVKVIVLDSNIKSLGEFKQIIGRGTRVKEEYGKTYFTIIDFRQVTNLFADPDFDGKPIEVFDIKQGENLPEILESDTIQEDKERTNSEPDKGIDWEETWLEKTSKRVKYYIDGVKVNILGKRTQVLDARGKLVNLEVEARQKLRNQYSNLNEFINEWSYEDKRDALVEELKEKGVYLAEIYDEYATKYQKNYDFFDLILHLAFDRPALSRRERAENVKKRDIFSKYSEQAQIVLNGLLQKYADKGIQEVESMTTLNLAPINALGTPMEIVSLFGGIGGYKMALKEMETEIYYVN